MLARLPSFKRKGKPKGSKWTKEEDERLRVAVSMDGERNWKKIAAGIVGRDDSQCLQRWSKTLKPGIVKGRWDKSEDELLVRLHGEWGPKWGDMSDVIIGRTSKQCRQRWCFQLGGLVNSERPCLSHCFIKFY